MPSSTASQTQAIVALELVGDRLEPQSQIVVDGLLRATFGRE